MSCQFEETIDDLIEDKVFRIVDESFAIALDTITENIDVLAATVADDETTNDEEKSYYLEGLLKMLSPTNEMIRKWIRDKLTC